MTETNHLQREGTKERRWAPRSPVSIGVIVLAITLIAGWAAGQGGSAPKLPDPSGALHFHAPSSGPVHFSGRLDRGAVLEHGDGVVRMELLVAADRPKGQTPLSVPTDLVVVLDRSGSMQGKPLHDAIAAVRELIASLGEDDRFALITYASDVQLAIPMQSASRENRAAWVLTANRVSSGGGTNMAIGIDLAAQTIASTRRGGRAPRVIVLSDGHANQGDHSHEGLRARAALAVSGEYVLSAVGVGLGFDESLMAALADSGTGNFYYVPDASSLGEVFSGEFDSARETVARSLAIEIELEPGVELIDAAGYPIERRGRVVRFRPGSLFGGQQRRIWLTLRVPTGQPGDHSLGVFSVAYRPVRGGANVLEQRLQFGRVPQVACVAREEEYVAALDRDLVLKGIGGDGLAALKQRVAAAVSSGDIAGAQERIRSYRVTNAVLFRQMDLAPEEVESDIVAAGLEALVKESASAPAAARSAFTKQLSLEGHDGRRLGAKKIGAKK